MLLHLQLLILRLVLLMSWVPDIKHTPTAHCQQVPKAWGPAQSTTARPCGAACSWKSGCAAVTYMLLTVLRSKDVSSYLQQAEVLSKLTAEQQHDQEALHSSSSIAPVDHCALISYEECL